jgi:hypothetical protein
MDKTTVGDFKMKAMIKQNRRRSEMIGKSRGLFFALTLFILFLPASASAQKGFWWGSPVTPGYDTSSVTELSGAVLQVDTSQRSARSSLRFESGGEIFTVTLGPSWYLRQQRGDIQIGDKLRVKGSKMKSREGKNYLVAAKIKNMRTGHVLELRDDSGLPLWSSRRRSDKGGMEEVKP